MSDLMHAGMVSMIPPHVLPAEEVKLMGIVVMMSHFMILRRLFRGAVIFINLIISMLMALEL